MSLITQRAIMSKTESPDPLYLPVTGRWQALIIMRSELVEAAAPRPSITRSGHGSKIA